MSEKITAENLIESLVDTFVEKQKSVPIFWGAPSNVPRLVLPEELFVNMATVVDGEINRGLRFLQDVACRGNLKQFLIDRDYNGHCCKLVTALQRQSCECVWTKHILWPTFVTRRQDEIPTVTFLSAVSTPLRLMAGSTQATADDDPPEAEAPDVDIFVLKTPKADVEVVADKDVENGGHASGNAHSTVPLAAVNKATEGNGAAGAKKLVFFGDASPTFDLEDLLTASAEVLGTFGTAYRAVLEAGPVVAMKMLMQRRSEKFV
ncbi:hypothetical protein Fmac_001985 [Flemingia macrophylla]|uniref:Uncharacterized protein n=1 Tax=Flemingia macrophylla TaxID=520843 RepID=A0ABD1NIM7_9FABA